MTTYGAEWSKHPYCDQDPLPEIEPALLNSADIQRYVERDCLLEKKSFDLKRMMPASYGLRFLGTLIRWKEEDGRLNQQSWTISNGESVTIDKNSIYYLWTEECLRLPEYIAARFNFRIREVHRGLLLGTGPMVDPGFGGRILIPLHNLTDNDYAYVGGDVFVWVEFTKVSTNRYWLAGGDEQERPKGLKKFPSDKVIDDPDGYLKKAGVIAAGAQGVQSAFKGELGKATLAADGAKSNAEEARRSAEKIRTTSGTVAILGFVGAMVGIGALLNSAHQISGQVSSRVDEQVARINKLEKRVDRIDGLESKLNGTDSSRKASSSTAGEATNSDESEPRDANGTLLGSGKALGSEVSE